MSLLDDVSIVVTPNGYKAGELYAVIPSSGAADMDVTRATDATRVDESGLIEDVLANVPRIDYTGGGCPHILAEPMRTNLIPYSEDLTQWTKSNASLINTITSTVISPDGVSYANKLYPIGSATSSYIIQSAAGDCFSMFIKKGERRWVLIYGGFANSNVWFDSENGVFGWVLSEATATVESFGNDWYRLKILWTQNSTQVRIYNTNSGTSTQSTGNGTDGIYIWGAQLEVGSYATSYIPTSGSTVTRNQDTFTRDGIGSLINSTEGVLFVEVAALADDETNREITLSDGTGSNYVLIRFNSGGSNRIYTRVDVGGGLEYFDLNTSHTITDTNKIAIRWGDSNFATFINGVKVGSQLSGSSFSADTLTELNFDNGTGNNNFFGKVKQLQVYDTALGGSPYNAKLSDDRLRALTS